MEQSEYKVFNKEQKEQMQKFLQNLYNDPKQGLLSKAKFYKKAKEINPQVSKNDVDEFFKTNSVSEIFTPLKKPTNLPIVGIPGAYQCDLIFLPTYKKQNKNYDTILILININSRFAYGIPLKGKSQIMVNKAILDIISRANKDERPISRIESDNGSEFISQSFKKILKEHNITHITAQVGDHNFLGKIDRFSRTIKTLINRFMASKNTTRWIDVFDQLLANYNSTTNRATNLKPEEVSPNKEKQINIQAKKVFKKELKKVQDVKIGDLVRIPNSKSAFEKEKAPYSTDIYQVVDVHASKVEVKSRAGNILKKKYNINQVLKTTSNVVDLSSIEKAKKKHKIQKRIQREGISL